MKLGRSFTGFAFTCRLVRSETTAVFSFISPDGDLLNYVKCLLPGYVISDPAVDLWAQAGMKQGSTG